MRQNENKFQPDRKIFSTCIYIIFTSIICVALIRAIWHWDSTKRFISELFSNFSPFLVGFLIAYIMGNLSNSIEHHFLINTLNIKSDKLRKGLSLVLSYVIAIAFISVALLFIVPAVVESLSDIAESVTILYNSLIHLIDSLSERYPSPAVEYVQTFIQDNMPELTQQFRKWVAGVAPGIANASFSVVKWVLNIIVAVIVSVYMLLDKDILTRSFKRIIYSAFNKNRADYIWATTKKANEIFSGYIIGKTIDSLIIGVLCLLLMKIFNIGGAYTVVISIFVGITNMIPYFGPFIGAIPSCIIILLAVSPKEALFFSILIIALQQFDGNILGPYILGDKTGLRPIWIIFAITIGGWFGGVMGMFLGVPFVAVIANILETIVEQRLENKGISDMPSLNSNSSQNNQLSFLVGIKSFLNITTKSNKKN